MEQTLQRSYARQTGAIGGSGPARLEQLDATAAGGVGVVCEEEIVDLKDKTRRGSFPRTSSGLPRIGVTNTSSVANSGATAPGDIYVKQMNYKSASSGDMRVRVRSPSAGLSGRVDWKAKYLK